MLLQLMKITKAIKVGFPHQENQSLEINSNNYFLLKNGTINADFAFQNKKRICRRNQP